MTYVQNQQPTTYLAVKYQRNLQEIQEQDQDAKC